MKSKRNYECPTFEAIVKLLEAQGRLTVAEIAELLGRHPRTIGRSIAEKKDRKARVFVAEWERNVLTGGRPSAVWAAGKGVDAPLIKSLSRSEISKSSYRNNKAKVLTAQKATRLKSKNLEVVQGGRLAAQWFDVLKV
jgi:predicted transcriptional regulator